MKHTLPKVTMISSLPPIVGLSPYTKGLVSALSKHVHINFLGFNHIYPKFLYPGKMTDETATVLEENNNLSIRNVLNWYNPLQWIIEAFKIKTHIIHAQWWSYPLAFLYIVILSICKIRRKKVILTIHNIIPHEKNPIKVFLNRSVFFLGDEYIVHTEENKKELASIVKKKPIHVIKHGLIKNPLKGILKEEARKLFNLSNEDKILLCFGHIRDYKGLDIALKALSMIQDKSIKLLIAGKCWEDWQKYQEIIDKFNLKKRVIQKIGFILTEEIEPLFRCADIILLPYKHFNAQSGVGALVLPFNVPLIVSKTGGLSDYVLDDACISDPEDHVILAQKIVKILQDDQLYQKLIRDLQHVQKELSWDNIAQKTIELYKTL